MLQSSVREEIDFFAEFGTSIGCGMGIRYCISYVLLSIWGQIILFFYFHFYDWFCMLLKGMGESLIRYHLLILEIPKRPR